MNFGERLRFLRNEQQYSLRELAIKLGISHSALGKYERGERQPDFKTLEIIADYFNVSIDWLLGRTSDRNSDSKIEHDISKKIESFKNELILSDELTFGGEPLSDAAKESLIESMEHIYKMTQRINKANTTQNKVDDSSSN